MFGLPADELLKREVDVIDIVNDKIESKDYVQVGPHFASSCVRVTGVAWSNLGRQNENRYSGTLGIYCTVL